MVSLEKIINKLKYQIDTNTSKIGTTDISEASSDDTLTTGLVEANNGIKSINLRMGTQVHYRVEKQANGDYYLYIDTYEPDESTNSGTVDVTPGNP